MKKQSKMKHKQLWQIFFDDGQSQEVGSTSRADRSSQANNSHGVLYRGLLEAESSSSEEEELERIATEIRNSTTSGGRTGELVAPPGGRTGELVAQRETVLFERPATELVANKVQNFSKPFNTRQWQSVDISQTSTTEQPSTFLQSGGARYIIRSESDLELAIPSRERSRKWCCVPTKGSQSETFEHYVCIVLIFVAMTAVYVTIVIAIVYGFK